MSECDATGVPAYEDPLEDDDAHALIDFNALSSRGQLERAAAKLTEYARQRGSQYRP